ncbi:hypothetical protein N7509_002745 [Penicillium cosmopolitanum]|uniref:SRP9 domain-containing protein n=1 Tax=Penicillium cosmopolitanum TaxID=1131564 RepID=A0A9W9W9N8_9EURO|nr:uncharacterized protein N7509_002745 [Penicillium cosmopolitanum]KAJ5408862.1 hypothetical protein N7509_002745 [Penicillium cosmopolitanum]
MTYLETSQAYLEQSAQLLEAYPETTRITTKYNFPTERPAQVLKRTKSQAKSNKPASTSTEPPTAPIASLTLRTYNPESGITIQYRTNKLQEVGRLMTGLGKLAAGADVASLGLSAPAGADIEMTDAPEEAAGSAPAPVPAAAKGQAQGGKGKKKKGGKK